MRIETAIRQVGLAMVRALSASAQVAAIVGVAQERLQGIAPGTATSFQGIPFAAAPTGCGWMQREGGPAEQIRPGDIVWLEPGKKPGHGATVTAPVTHIAIAEALDGKGVDWLEHVSDPPYRGRLIS